MQFGLRPADSRRGPLRSMSSVTSATPSSSLRTEVQDVLNTPRSSLAESPSTSSLASNVLTRCPSRLKVVDSQTRRGSKRLRSLSVSAAGADPSSSAPRRRRGQRCVRSHGEKPNSKLEVGSGSCCEQGKGAKCCKSKAKIKIKSQSKVEAGKAKADAELCLICMDPFSEEFPASQIPCKKQCNSAPVHEKCIYEWQEFQPGKSVVSCPLCRSKLYPISYFPPDVIRSVTFSDFCSRKSFLLHPVPREAGVVRCYINAVRTGFFSVGAYELYLQAPTTLKYPLGPLPDNSGPREGDRLLAVARKQVTAWGCAQLDMSMDTKGVDFDDLSENYLGCVQSSFSGLDHNILVPQLLKDGRASMCELGAVRYTQNRIRSTVGPRRVQVCLPAIKQVANSRSPRQERRAPMIIPAPLPGSCQYRRMRDSNIHQPAKCEPEVVGEDTSSAESGDEKQKCGAEADKWASKVHISSERKESLAQILKRGPDHSHDARDEVMFAKNKEPYWLDAIQAYSLDFQGRVTLPSNKNFQLLMENGPLEDDCATREPLGSKSEIVLQFGKVEDNLVLEMYTMDVQWPLSPLQAFGICLSACDRKLLLS